MKIRPEIACAIKLRLQLGHLWLKMFYGRTPKAADALGREPIRCSLHVPQSKPKESHAIPPSDSGNCSVEH